VYDAEQFGARLVASPRHADALLVTGVVTHNMRDALIDTFVATPEPKLVIAMGDCACDGGMFREGYGVAGTVRDFVPVDVELRGCPPTPDQIVETLRKVTGR
jgi:Ni,Fe-hydrogenase III small subunit